MTDTARPITDESARKFITLKSAHALLALIASGEYSVAECRAIARADMARTAEKAARRNGGDSD